MKTFPQKSELQQFITRPAPQKRYQGSFRVKRKDAGQELQVVSKNEGHRCLSRPGRRNKIPRSAWLKPHLFLSVLEAGRSELQRPAGLERALFLTCLHTVQRKASLPCVFLQGQQSHPEGSTHRPNHFPQVSLPNTRRSPKHWKLGLRHVNLGGAQFSTEHGVKGLVQLSINTSITTSCVVLTRFLQHLIGKCTKSLQVDVNRHTSYRCEL